MAKRTHTAPRFTKLHAIAESLGESNDCTVKALALTTGIGYHEAHATMKAHGRPDGRGWYMSAPKYWGMPYCVTLSVLAVHGHTAREIPLSVLRARAGVENLTIGRVASMLPRRGRYLVWVRGHILAVVNGQIEDWTGAWAGRKVSRKHVLGVARVVKA
jgi:hypothetical protein